MDGIDAALIDTDGESVHWLGPSLTFPFDAGRAGFWRAPWRMRAASTAAMPAPAGSQMRNVS